MSLVTVSPGATHAVYLYKSCVLDQWADSGRPDWILRHRRLRMVLLRHMRHQELWRAVGTHYGPTRIYGPTAMPSEGRHSRHSRTSTADNAPGFGTTSDEYGPAAICRSMDLAAAARARATRMSRLWAGDAAGGRGPERRRATGPTTTRPQERGDASVREHGTRSAVQVNSTRHVLGIYYSD